MPVSVHIADVGPVAAMRLLARPLRLADTPGLRHREVALAKPLGDERLPHMQLGRICLIAYWDDDASIDAFLSSRASQPFAGGWRARLDPVRAFGPWPGLDDDLPRTRTVPTRDGPSVVITLARTRLTQFPRFMQATRRAEAAAAHAPGLRWGTAIAKPPFLATCTIWESDDALMAYAYGGEGTPHSSAMQEDRRKAFHHQMTFVRFRPYELSGHLEGRNPIDDAH
jgi:hypothetical protein